MYSITYLFLLATNVIGVWMVVFFGTAHSNPLSDQMEGCGGSGSACEIKSDSDLRNQFKLDNEGLETLYLKKLIIGNETAYVGSWTYVVNNSCKQDLVMEYDSARFPQYIINSICNDNSCEVEREPEPFKVRKLDTTVCDSEGQQKYIEQKLFLTVCKPSEQ